MAQIDYRVNLSAAVFPMPISKSGRSVIIPGADHNFDRRIDAPGDTQRGSVGIPQVMYMENVLPTPDGYQSVGLLPAAISSVSINSGQTYLAAMLYVEGVIDNIAIGLGDNSLFLAFWDNNTVRHSRTLESWVNSIAIVPSGFLSPRPNTLTSALVNGVTYFHNRDPAVPGGTPIICSVNVNLVTGTVIIVDTGIISLPGGVGYGAFIAICGSYNYLIIATATRIYWSSLTDPTDFAPSLITGAGNESPSNLKGNIKTLKAHPDGFFIYTDKSTVFAQYTGNSRYPWKFREVTESGGILFPYQVTGGFNSSAQYIVNNSKFLQEVNKDAAQVIAPEITDFTSRAQYFDSFDYANNTFSEISFIEQDFLYIKYILDRYIIVGYHAIVSNGITSWRRCIVYDVLLKRYGQLKVSFFEIFEFKKSIYFVDPITRLIFSLSFEIEKAGGDYINYNHVGVLLLGKYEYRRNRWLCLDELYVETVEWKKIVNPGTRNFQALILQTLNGKTFLSPVVPYDNTEIDPLNLPKNVHYLAHQSCQNFSLLFKGTFDFNTVQLTFHPEGDS
jgi:hypothetical protein